MHWVWPRPLSSVRSDVRAKKLYIGAMGIGNQPFLPSYEDSNSPEFAHLASLVAKQVRPRGPKASWELSTHAPLQWIAVSIVCFCVS